MLGYLFSYIIHSANNFKVVVLFCMTIDKRPISSDIFPLEEDS